MRKAGLRMALLLGVLGALLTGAEARALALRTTANLLTAPPPNGPNDPPNCNLLINTGGPTTCVTTAGTATAVADLWSLGGLVSTQGTRWPGSPVHHAAASASFVEDLTAPGAPPTATLVATFDLSGTFTAAAGVVAPAGFIQLTFSGTVLSATNASSFAGGGATWLLDETDLGLFSETAVVSWIMTGGAVPGLDVLLEMRVANTGLELDFLNTFELVELEAFNSSGDPIALDLFDPAGNPVGSTVPEPGTAILLLPALLVAARRRRS